MAAKDTLVLKAKIVPDDSALKNYKMPEIKIGGKSGDRGLLETYNTAVRKLNKDLSKGTDSSAIIKDFKAVESEAVKAKTQINTMIESVNKAFQSPGNQALLKDYQSLEKQLKKLDKESQTRRKTMGDLSALKAQGKMTTVQAKKEISKSTDLLNKGEALNKQDLERLEIAKQIVAKEEELHKLRTQEQIKGDQRNVKFQMGSDKFKEMRTAEGSTSQINEYTGALNLLIGEEQRASARGKDFSNMVKETQEQVKKTKKEVLAFGDIISGTFLGTSLSNLFQTGLSKGVQFFKEYDETLTRTMMVTTMTRDEVNDLTTSYNDLANQLSSTTKDVAAAQLVFYQQGLNTQDALKMTEASIAISKTGGIEAAEAADRLTAAIRGYQLSANDAMDIADKMSALDAAAASSVDELTVAMQKSASQARMAGLDLDYYMAYLSTMQEVTREAPENIGTAMKSITSRLQEIKDIGKIEEDGTTFSNVAKALTSIGIAAVDSSGQLRNLQDIMNELGPMWETLDRNHQAYIATTLAGNRQQSRFIALMDNYDRAMELVNVSQNAAGETSKQLRDYNTGLEASFEKLSNAWQQFATKVAASSSVKVVIDWLTSLIELVNDLPDGLVRTVAGIVAMSKVWATFAKLSKAQKIGSWIKEKIGIAETIDTIKNGFTDLITNANQLITALKNVNNVNLDNITKEVDNLNSSVKETAETSRTTSTQGTSSDAGNAIMAGAGANSQKLEELGKKLDAYSTETDKRIKEEAKNLDKRKKVVATESRVAKFDYLSEQIKGAEERKKDILKAYERGVDQEEARLQKENKREYNRALKEMNKRPEGQYMLDFNSPAMNREIRLMDFVKDPASIKTVEEISKKTKKEYEAENKKIEGWKKEQADWLIEFQEEEEREKQAVQENTAAVEKNTNALEGKKPEGGSQGESGIKVESAGAENKETEQWSEKKIWEEIEKTEKPLDKKSADGVKEVLSDKNVKKIEKIKTGLDNVKKGVKSVYASVQELDLTSKAFSAFTIKSLVSMTVNFLPGVNDELANMIGNLAGGIKFAKDFGSSLNVLFEKVGKGDSKLSGLFSKLNGKGIAIMLAIEGIVYFATKAWNANEAAAEKAEKNLNESLDAWDKTSEAYNNMKKLSETYDELSGKINKTTEEQEQLNNAVNELAEIAPDAVVGYDLQGNAIIDTSKIDEAMNEKRIENAENANGAILDAVKKANADAAKEADTSTAKWSRGIGTAAAGAAAGAVGWKAGAAIGAVGGPIGIIAGAIIGAGAGYLLSKAVTDRIQRDAKAQALYSSLQEQSATVIKGITQQSSEAILEGAEEEAQNRQELAAYLTRGSFNKFAEELVEKQREDGLSDKEVEELTNQYQADMNDAFSRLSKVGGLDRVNEIIEGIQSKLNKGASWSDVSTALDTQLNAVFAKAGIDDETAKKLVSGIQSKIFSAMGGNIPEMQAQVQAIIDKIKAGDKKADTTQLENIKSGLANLNQATAGALEATGLLDNLTDPESQEVVKELLGKTEEFNKAAIAEDGTLNQNAATVKMLNYLYSTLGNTMDGVRGDAIKSVMNSLQSTVAPTFSEIASTVQDSIATFNTLIDVMDKLKDSGGRMTLDTFTELLNVLDSIEAEAFSDFDNIDQYTAAFGRLTDGISVVNGEMAVQADSIQALAEIQRLSFIATMKQKLEEVKIAIAENEFEGQLIDAQIAALEEGLAYEGDVANAKVLIADTLEKELEGIGADWLSDETTKYANYVGMVSQALSEAGSYFNKYYTAIATGDFSTFEDDSWKTTPDQVLKSLKSNYATAVNDSIKDLNADNFNDVIQTTINGLKKRKEANENENKVLNNKKALLEGMISTAEAGNNALSKFSSDSADSASDYNKQLEKTLTLLEKISGIAHKMSKVEALQSLYEGWDGKKSGEYLLKNLELSEANYEAQKDLFDLQQEMTNQAAGDLLDSPYGYLFNITEEGDIGFADPSKFEEYENLSGDMQEDIDGLVQAYQEQRDALRDTELEMIEYAKTVKETREAIRDLTIEVEDEIVEALKNRESILHEARQKALEDEIDMIEEAVEARKKAREDDESSKDLYKAQEALRRATLDSSGKNNAQLLQLQQELEDKQLEIAEKRFEDDMDDRKQWLQDTKDAETETYEYRLETMTWYWEQVQSIMESSTDEIMNFMITWDKEYKNASVTQQTKLKEQWDSTFNELKTITEKLNDPIEHLKIILGNVTAEVENQTIKIDALPGSWQKATEEVNNYASALNKVSTIKTSGGRTTTDTKGETGGDDDTLPTGDKTGGSDSTSTARYKVGDTVESKNSGVFAKTKRYGWDSKKGAFVDDYSNDQTVLYGSYKFVVGDVKKYKGEYYYKDENGYNDWVKESDLKYGTGFSSSAGKGGGGGGGRAFATGGMVDYTGPAWVDGTKTKPEAFLSAYQTEQIGALAKAIDPSTVNNAATNSNITFGSVNFNVASMSSAADGKKALEVFVQGANDMMAKKGIGTKLNLNVK